MAEDKEKILLGLPEMDDPKTESEKEDTRDCEFENSRYLNSRLPSESKKNNRYFHPISSNTEYLRLINGGNLPILSTRFDYRRFLREHKNKLVIVKDEIKKYQALYDETSAYPSEPPTAGFRLTN